MSVGAMNVSMGERQLQYNFARRFSFPNFSHSHTHTITETYMNIQSVFLNVYNITCQGKWIVTFINGIYPPNHILSADVRYHFISAAE